MNIKHLQKTLKENEKAIKNLLLVLERGDISEVITKRIAEKQEEQKQIEAAIVEEKKKAQPITEQAIRFFLSRLQQGDINDLKYRRALVALFVNKMFLYDDKMTIIFNVSGKSVSVNFDLITDIECDNIKKQCSAKAIQVHQLVISP